MKRDTRKKNQMISNNDGKDVSSPHLIPDLSATCWRQVEAQTS